MTAGVQSSLALTGASSPVFGGSGGLQAATGSRSLRLPLCETDSEATTTANNLHMPHEIMVDLMAEIDKETDILPTSCEHESDMDIPLPPDLPAVEVDVATREISQLLLEIPSGHSPALGMNYGSSSHQSPTCNWL